MRVVPQENLLRSGVANAEFCPLHCWTSAGLCRSRSYGNANLGVSEPQKAGHEIQVESIALGDLIEEYSLRPPDVVRIDVEGVETGSSMGCESSRAGQTLPRVQVAMGCCTSLEVAERPQLLGRRRVDSGGTHVGRGLRSSVG